MNKVARLCTKLSELFGKFTFVGNALEGLAVAIINRRK